MVEIKGSLVVIFSVFTQHPADAGISGHFHTDEGIAKS